MLLNFCDFFSHWLFTRISPCSLIIDAQEIIRQPCQAQELKLMKLCCHLKYSALTVNPLEAFLNIFEHFNISTTTLLDFYRKRRINEYTNNIIMEEPFHSLHRVKKNDTELELWSINKSDFFVEFRNVANIGMPFCIVGLLGNGILFWLLCCTIKRTRFTIYILNMTIGDFIILIYYFVAYLLIFLPSHARFYKQQIKVISLVFGSGTSIYFLTAITVERYIMVSCPLSFQSYRKKNLTPIICFILWILSVTLTIIEYFFCNPRYLKSHIIEFLYCHTAIVLEYIINYLLFIPVMVLSTLFLIIKMPKNPPTGLDTSIVVIVFLHILLSACIKILIFINYLIKFMPSSQYRRVSLIFDCWDATFYPFVYLLVGIWKREKYLEPLSVLIGRGLNYNSNSNMRIQPNQDQA